MKLVAGLENVHMIKTGQRLQAKMQSASYTLVDLFGSA